MNEMSVVIQATHTDVVNLSITRLKEAGSGRGYVRLA